MSKPYHNLTLAKSPEQWREIDRVVDEAVRNLAVEGYDKAESLYVLLDLLTNERYERSNRELVAFHALRTAFTYTESFEKAMETEAERLNPVAVRKTA